MLEWSYSSHFHFALLANYVPDKRRLADLSDRDAQRLVKGRVPKLLGSAGKVVGGRLVEDDFA